MLSMFNPGKDEKRKAVIAEVNKKIKATFEEAFAEDHQLAREILIQGGVPEEKVGETLNEIKAELEQEIIIRAQQLLREKALKIAKEGKSGSFKGEINADQSLDISKNNRP